MRSRSFRDLHLPFLPKQQRPTASLLTRVKHDLIFVELLILDKIMALGACMRFRASSENHV